MSRSTFASTNTILIPPARQPHHLVGCDLHGGAASCPADPFPKADFLAPGRPDQHASLATRKFHLGLRVQSVTLAHFLRDRDLSFARNPHDQKVILQSNTRQPSPPSPRPLRSADVIVHRSSAETPATLPRSSCGHAAPDIRRDGCASRIVR